MPQRSYGLFQNDANKRLIARLQSVGAGLLLLPPVTVDRTSSPAKIALAGVDWLVFADIRAVDHFLERIADKYALDDLRICALGEAVADRLRFSQLHADVIPARRETEVVLRALSDYEDPSGKRFCLPVASGRHLEIAERLSACGAVVEEIPVCTVRDLPERTRWQTLLGGGAIDEFIFTDPRDVFDLAFYIDLETAEFAVSAPDEPVLQTLREFGFSL